MLRSATELFGTKLAASDGDIGTVHDFLFDDETWTVRYMVADTGNWLTGRLVLLAPQALGHADSGARYFPVNLTKQQIESSPPIEADLPVNRRHEIDINAHYGWRDYWGGGLITASTLGGFTQAAEPPGGDSQRLDQDRLADQQARARQDEDIDHPELRSVRDVSGYDIESKTGQIGVVDDFLMDDADWTVRYMAVDTHKWLPSKDVLVSPGWIKKISWHDHAVIVDLGKQKIEEAPEYKRGMHISRAYEEQLFRHYGLDPYWGKAAGAQRY
ncbi:MAG TPA: PRC-barrel domain-containing protein [Dehalococcoidia bacterium]|nr:PRC-barrel domain-containing protein [Dehalococcoidia bacterium]